jgi:hypothetical protein
MHRSVWLLIAIFLLSLGFVQGAEPANFGNVCSSTPDSLAGRGGVALCNVFYACGVSDNVCPEDFYSSVSQQQGSCSNCPDPDCMATVGGTVQTELGELVPNAEVYAFYPGEDGTITKLIDTTIVDGTFSASNVPSGFLNFYVTYEDYESATIPLRVIRGSSHTVDFELAQGSCNADCTGTISGRVQASCQGVNGCDFNGTGDYPSDDIARLCDQRLPTERVVLDVTGNDITYAYCNGEGVESQTRSQVALGVDPNTNIANLVSYTQRARLNGEQVQFVITTWTED